LDPVARIELLDILRDFVADGERSVLISSHITSDLDKAADYITLIIDGEIAESEPLDILEEKYALISGSIDDLRGKEYELVGVRKGEMTFDALVLREKLKLFPGVAVHTPNLENILTFSIWGRRERRRKA
ncbi:MAG TPA: ABC transporter ATP-binding protein, partial [Oscillospiraceae bacterium]|nr:ABC transporter ATP-binding protein [Oscillospiraceae bacterium]